MKWLTSILLAMTCFFADTTPVLAQAAARDRLTALGASFGAALPARDGPDNGPQLAATAEGNLMPNLSLLGEAGMGWIGGDTAFRSDFRRLYAVVNIVYDWRRAAWRPYATGGIGVYRYTASLSPNARLDPALRDELVALGLDPTLSSGITQRDTDFGTNVGGGIEYFISPRSTIGGDVRYHGVGHIFDVLPTNGSYVSVSAMFKKFF